MKSFTSSFRRLVHLPLLCLVLLVPFKMIAQQNKTLVKSRGSASYTGINNGKFLKTWWVAGPAMDSSVGHTVENQERFFNEDPAIPVNLAKGKPLSAIQIKGKNLKWQLYTSKEDIIDFDSLFNNADYAAGYALAEIIADSTSPVLLAIGSDDGVKVWLNGKPVHTNWIGRGTVPDDDIVPVTLVKGSNQLLVKVQDMQGGWGFIARFLDKAALSKRLVAAAGNGKADDVNMLIKAGATLNEADAMGLTPLDAAKLQGRDEIVKLLLQKGATDKPLPPARMLIDGLYSSLNGKTYPGIAILVAKDGNILYKKGFGYADIENKTLVSPDTKFRIGSITKQFIASAILKLQEEGKLLVTDKLSKFVPDFPRGDEVTLHHLLTHTSGIHSFTDKEDFISKVVSPVKSEDLITSIKKDSFDFSPGEQWRYNNSGYFLLGYIVEKVTGKSFGQYLKETFFDPLQMNNTGVHASTLKLANEAKGYTKNNSVYEKALNWDMSWAGGAGALYSTVEDLYKWNEAVFGGKVLTNKSLEAAFTPVLLNNGKTPPGGEYGYGWGIGKYRGLRVIQHSGGLHGFLSQLSRFPDEHLTVVMLTNVTPAQVNLNPNSIGEIYLSDKMEKQSTYSAMPSLAVDLKAYEGRYDFQTSGVMTITSDGKNLFAQLTGQGKFPVFPSAPDEFFWKVVEAKIKFIRNEKGEVTSGQFHQNGGEVNVPKLPEEAIAKVDTAIYKQYAGNYQLGKDTVTISTNKGKIFATATGEPQFEIFPLSDTTFIVKELNARLIFFREPGGDVSKIIIDMGGQKRDALRIKK